LDLSGKGVGGRKNVVVREKKRKNGGRPVGEKSGKVMRGGESVKKTGPRKYECI